MSVTREVEMKEAAVPAPASAHTSMPDAGAGVGLAGQPDRKLGETAQQPPDGADAVAWGTTVGGMGAAGDQAEPARQQMSSLPQAAVRAQFVAMDVGELVGLCSRVVAELGRRVALAQYGQVGAITNARDLAEVERTELEAAREAAPATQDVAVGAACGADGEATAAADDRYRAASGPGGAGDGSQSDGDRAGSAGDGAAGIATGAGLSAADALALSSGPFAIELVETVTRASDQLRAVAATAAARIDATGLWAGDGSRSVNAYLIRKLRIAPVTASTLVRVGKLIRDYMPALGRAVLAGQATWDHAVAAKHAATSTLRRDTLTTSRFEEKLGRKATGDEVLTYHSGTLDAAQFRLAAKHFAACTDPEADERGYREVQEREYVTLSPTLGGYHLEGFLTQEHGKQVQAAIAGVIGVPSADDARTPAQRRAQGLADVAGMVLAQGEVGSAGGVKPQLVVTVAFETLQALAARTAAEIDLDKLVGLEPAQWADGTGPLPPGLLARLACDSAIARVIFGPAGEVLNQGRSYRTFTAAQRAALVARDRHCQFPGCTAPPKLCEGHHLVFWSRGGKTDLDNAVLLCWHHHDYIHAGHIQITKRPDGGFAFTRPDGSVIV